MMLDKLVLALVIIGALNWGSIGIFQFDLVAALFGGQAALLSRIVYTLVALAGVWAISFFFRDTEVSHRRKQQWQNGFAAYVVMFLRARIPPRLARSARLPLPSS